MSNTQQQEAAIALLKEYEQWEADLINNNDLWWPNKAKDVISGEIYDKMIELQAKRNELFNNTPQPKEEVNIAMSGNFSKEQVILKEEAKEDVDNIDSLIITALQSENKNLMEQLILKEDEVQKLLKANFELKEQLKNKDQQLEDLIKELKNENPNYGEINP